MLMEVSTRVCLPLYVIGSLNQNMIKKVSIRIFKGSIYQNIIKEVSIRIYESKCLPEYFKGSFY